MPAGQRPEPVGVVHGPVSLTSPILRRDVALRVYVPHGVGEGVPRAAVVYLQDGQNVFGEASPSPSGLGWRLETTIDGLIAAGDIRPTIAVAIDHAGDARIDEYTPTRDRLRQRGGRAARYARFLLEELKPFVDAEFPTDAQPAATALAGSSMGGLVTLAVGLRHPHVFGALGVMSPSVWWGRRAILRSIRARRFPVKPRIWLDVGHGEPEPAVDDVRALRRVLLRSGWSEPDDLRYHEDPIGDHGEAAWAGRAAEMLRFLVPPVA